MVARFNSAITEKLLEGAQRRAQQGRSSRVFECSMCPARSSCRSPRKCWRQAHTSGIIALGAVIRGDTPHFDYVAGEAARGLQQVALETGMPVAFGVLTTDTLAQAEARAGGKHGNKGYDAAMTAIEMARFGGKRREITCPPDIVPASAPCRCCSCGTCASSPSTKRSPRFTKRWIPKKTIPSPSEPDEFMETLVRGATEKAAAIDRASPRSPSTGVWSACPPWTAISCAWRSTK